MQNADRLHDEVASNDGEYEAPRIELVVSENRTRREVQNAGNRVSSGQIEPSDQTPP